ncbi:probable ATP-dependent RNA helicase DDX58, partial [Exaiptasia diaphana]|uniref:Helicase ATP-binding domain-containing protein n=1 Tax=Exaiptasia diaphana TaxID=2652724 RepID=A0A913XLT2_EXADI
MATGVTSPSSFSAREKTNFIRLSRLLIDVGRRVFQDVFDSMHPPSTLHAVLNSIPVKNKLLRLQSCKVLHTQQWNLLYPTSGIAQSKDFDITLLFLLLRNFCGLRIPSRGWDSEPTPTNLTMEDDLVRIKLCRNMIYAHIVEMALTDDEFESYWDKIEAALNRLGKSKYKTQIEHLKFTSIDHEMNNCYHALVQSWEEMKCNANQQEYTMIIRGIIKTLTAGGTILAWTAGSAYFLMRYREDPETVIRLVREAIVPSGFATSAIVYALLPGSFKILVEINSDALDYISRSLNDGSLRKNLENVIVTDKLCHLAPDGTKKVLLSVVSLEVLLESHTSNEQKKDLELREYQKELARPAMEGRNAIICAPTNSGKTFVAMAIAKHHLVQFSKKDDSEELGAAAATKSTSNGKPKVIFIVSNLVLQQRSRFEEYLTNYSISDISGSNSTEIPLDFLLKTHDVIVLTAQILLNALQKGSVKISQITLLVFDECHHTNKDHNYNKIMQNYMALKYQSDPNIKLPQIVGLTASFGTRRSNTTQNTQNYILQICANMDASCISTVRTNLKELKKNVTGGVPRRKLEKVDQQPNVFENVIVQVMEKIEIAAQTVSPTSIVTSIPPADRVGQQYRQWVEGIEKEAISKALRDLSTYAKHLKRYHIALLINDTVRTKDAIQYLQEFFDNLDQGKFLSSDKKLQELFEKAINGIKSRIEKTEPKNPKLEKLKELILKFYEEDKVKDRKGETKGILFTKTRDSTKGLMGWIQETDELKS